MGPMRLSKPGPRAPWLNEPASGVSAPPARVGMRGPSGEAASGASLETLPVPLVVSRAAGGSKTSPRVERLRAALKLQQDAAFGRSAHSSCLVPPGSEKSRRGRLLRRHARTCSEHPIGRRD